MQPPRPSKLLLSAPLSAKLAVAGLVFLSGGVAFRAISYNQMNKLSEASSEVQNRWLDTVRVLGRLNGHVAILRTEEAESLSRRGRGASGDLGEHATAIERDIEAYEALPHDPEERRAFSAFLSAWSEARRDVDQIAAMEEKQDRLGLDLLYRGDSHSAFRSLAASLRNLIDVTNMKADAARFELAEVIKRTSILIDQLFLGTLLLFVILALFVWRSYSRPLLILARLMQRLATCDTAFEAPYKDRRDEVGDVARSLKTFRENTIELLQSRTALAANSERLENILGSERALAARQRNFIHTMSHELRTPLTYVDGHAQRLLATKDSENPSQVADRAQRIRLAALQITRVVESLTGALSIIEQEPKMTEVNLSEIVQAVCARHRQIGGAGGLDCDIPAGELIVRGDRELLQIAFGNLISNAFKYSAENGDVRVTARRIGGSIEAQVLDHGIGIPPDDIGRVEQPYYRASNVRSVPGTGMGLYIVSRIVQQHGGTLKLESEVGRGTKVTITLPYAETFSNQVDELHADDTGDRRRLRDSRAA